MPAPSALSRQPRVWSSLTGLQEGIYQGSDGPYLAGDIYMFLQGHGSAEVQEVSVKYIMYQSCSDLDLSGRPCCLRSSLSRLERVAILEMPHGHV